MPSSSIASASARMPRPEVFSERKSSSMMTMGKRNFMAASILVGGGAGGFAGAGSFAGRRWRAGFDAAAVRSAAA